jgi:peptide/nickel transport system permease protein
MVEVQWSDTPWRPAARSRLGAGAAFRSPRLRLWSSAIVLGVLVAAVIVVPLVVQLDQQIVDLSAANRPPELAHPFGTDELGRDVLLRCIHGLRVSLTVGLVAALVSTLIGTAVGALAGSVGGWTDRLLMRVVDAVAAVPHLLLGIIIVAVLRPSLGSVVLSIALTHWLSSARIVRSEVLSLRGRPFIDAAIVGGSSRLRIMARHLLPNVAPQVLLGATLMVPHAIWHETALSFLGLGLPAHLASIGNMLNDAARSLLAGGWWMSFAPGFVFVVTTLTVAGLGGVWRDWLNPHRRSESAPATTLAATFPTACAVASSPDTANSTRIQALGQPDLDTHMTMLSGDVTGRRFVAGFTRPTQPTDPDRSDRDGLHPHNLLTGGAPVRVIARDPSFHADRRLRGCLVRLDCPRGPTDRVLHHARLVEVHFRTSRSTSRTSRFAISPLCVPGTRTCSACGSRQSRQFTTASSRVWIATMRRPGGGTAARSVVYSAQQPLACMHEIRRTEAPPKMLPSTAPVSCAVRRTGCIAQTRRCGAPRVMTVLTRSGRRTASTLACCPPRL